MVVEVDIRVQILDAANRLFAANGFEGASLQAIADVVGIRKPSLLYHYPSKEALRRAVLSRLLAHWNDVLPAILQVATTGSRRFDGVIEEVAAFFREDPDRARLLMREMLDRPDEMRELLRHALAPWIAILADYIRQGQASGRIYDDLDPEAWIVTTIHSVAGGVALADVYGVLLVDADEQADDMRFERQLAEILRAQRRSLFVPRPRGTTATEAPDGDDHGELL